MSEDRPADDISMATSHSSSLTDTEESQRERSQGHRRTSSGRSDVTGKHVRVFRSSYRVDEQLPENEAAADDGKFDFIFVVAHGASFSSALLETYLKDFLKTLEILKALWFWELKLRIHVELIDWKSVLAPFQNGPMSRVMPKSQIDETSEKGETRPDSFLSNKLRSLFGSSQPSAAPENQPSPAIPEFVDPAPKSPMVILEREDSTDTHKNILIQSGAQNIRDFDMLFKSSGPRVYFNNIVADVLCYLTPRYGDYLVDQMSSLINLKIRDLKNDPSGKFADARIVLIGHSLGSVLLYEILTGDPIRERAVTPVENEPQEGIFPGQPLPSRRTFETPPTFEFDVDHFFLWGSPLAAFMLLGNKKHFSGGQSLGLKTKIYNMFHRQDPIALRLEPLLYPELEKIPPPVTLPNYRTNTDTDPQMAWKKSVEAVVSSGSAIKQMASTAFSRIFPSRDGNAHTQPPMVAGMRDAVFRNYVQSSRYTLVDPYRKSKRYGTIESPDADGAETGGERKLSRRVQSGNKLNVSLFLSRSVSDQSAVSKETSDIKKTDSLPQGGDMGEFNVAKGDAAAKNPLPPPSTKLRSIDNMLKPQALHQRPRPWTSRQLIIHIAARIRKSFFRYVEKRMDSLNYDASDPDILAKQKQAALQAIEDELEDFITQRLKAKISKLEASPDLTQREFVDRGKARDLHASESACQRELVRELQGDVSETEALGGDQLPSRVDFVISGSVIRLFAEFRFHRKSS
eukprot:Gregarina_sp_Poly_1__9117@NODE_559_length_7530_cov_48_357899_g440_i0_p2_GENE_NODE_559_length_7530_cov_48_357899_g440_i0NODE_559_length_7530_cov_48_357899_g440_i0_p2_ORF_typecomplete_len743_score105_70DDHD/PF02862_17/3e03DDHD/PF02862_17/3_9e21Abhydrolase_6/PF12697_7/0_015Abhydrolase_6/PF12697_7/9_9e03PGAP1/PF07819_13/0_68PGAP1/PF07819_13/7_8e02LIDHydrolase/PF10230_9/0_14Ser_hydrolase/PF06821_13/0_46_NODE_559_length_7530_cov_48_357899_g440_i038926120